MVPLSLFNINNKTSFQLIYINYYNNIQQNLFPFFQDPYKSMSFKMPKPFHLTLNNKYLLTKYR